jgi:hypothetical protein
MKNKKPTVNHTDITKAIQKFQKQGGLIKRLPDQVVPKGMLVGGKFAMFETIFEPNTAGSGSGVSSSAGSSAIGSNDREAAAAE